MTTETDILASLEYIPTLTLAVNYLSSFNLKLVCHFDQEKVLQFVVFPMLISASSSTSCANLKVLLDQSANYRPPSRTILRASGMPGLPRTGRYQLAMDPRKRNGLSPSMQNSHDR